MGECDRDNRVCDGQAVTHVWRELGSEISEKAMNPPSEVLYNQLLKMCKGWASEWDLGKHAVVGVLEEVKHDILWETDEDDEDLDDE